MRLRSAWAVLLALAVLAIASVVLAKPAPKGVPSPTPSVSAAPPPPATPEEAEARRHFEIGLKLYAEKAFDAALIEFEASYKLNPRPSALRNVAQCHRDLKHFAEAHDTYARLLAAHAGQLSPTEKAAIAKAMKDLEIVTGSVDLQVNEAGANVQVDERAIGQTPLEKPIRVDVGKHVVKVFKSGFEPVERDVEIIAQVSVQLSITLNKEVKTGHVTIREETGKDVHVFVDDVDVGPAPWTGDLSSGPHSVELKGDTYAAPKRNIDVVTKGTFDIAIEALPLLGHLKVQTLGKIGEISIDNKKMGEGIWEGDLPPGSYEVGVIAKGYQPYKHLVSVTKGQLVEEDVTLVALPPPAPPPPKPPPPAADPYVGLYSKFAVVGVFPLSGRPSLDPCTTGAASNASCSKSGLDMPIGAKLHVGYAWGVFGFEFVGAFLYDLSHELDRNVTGKGTAASTISLDADTTVTRTEAHKLSGWATFFGIGPRVTSKDDAVRFTFGTAFGGVYRSTSYSVETLGTSQSASDVTSFAPGLLVDAGLLLGSTPGTKFTIGVVGWMELSSSHSTDLPGFHGTSPAVTVNGRSQQLITGAQFFIGPTLGLQFGR